MVFLFSASLEAPGVGVNPAPAGIYCVGVRSGWDDASQSQSGARVSGIDGRSDT